MEKQITNKQVTNGCAIGCGGLIILIILLGILLTSCSSDKTFSFTAKEFETTLKQEINRTKGNSFIEIKDMRKDDDDYIIELANGIYIFISTDENDYVTEVRTGATHSAFLVLNKEVRIAFEATLASVDKQLSVIQTLSIFEKLGITGKSDMLDVTKSHAFNNIIYSYKGDMEKELVVLYAKPL